MKTVTCALIIKDGRVLIARRAPGQQQARHWEFPGGKCEPGETLKDCLERELFEELGIRAQADTTFATSEHRYAHGAIRLVALFAHITEGTPAPTVHDRLTWVLPGELCGYDLAPADIPLAEQLARHLERTSPRNTN